MGLFKEIALLPLAPVRGTTWVAEQLAEEADRRLYDQDRIRREFVQLEIDAQEGLIGPKEREAKEDELLERLAVAREREIEERELLEAEAREVVGPAEAWEPEDTGRPKQTTEE